MTFGQPLHFRTASAFLLVLPASVLLGHSFHLAPSCPSDKDGKAMADKIVGIGPYQYVHILNAVSEGDGVLHPSCCSLSCVHGQLTSISSDDVMTDR